MEQKNQIHEASEVRQRPDEGYRRWLLNNYFDIILWYDKKDGELIGFQFCYGKPYDERAYTYGSKIQSHHHVSGSGTEDGRHTLASSILTGDAGWIDELVIDKFKKESQLIDKNIVSLIINKIYEYNGRFRKDSCL